MLASNHFESTIELKYFFAEITQLRQNSNIWRNFFMIFQNNFIARVPLSSKKIINKLNRNLERKISSNFRENFKTPLEK